MSKTLTPNSNTHTLIGIIIVVFFPKKISFALLVCLDCTQKKTHLSYALFILHLLISCMHVVVIIKYVKTYTSRK